MSIINRVVLFVNHNAEKTVFDRIGIYLRNDGKFTVYFKADCTISTQTEKTPTVLVHESHHDLLDYLEDMLDLMMNDCDTPSCPSIDVMIPHMPVVALNPKNYETKSILLRAMRSWTKSAAAMRANESDA